MNKKYFFIGCLFVLITFIGLLVYKPFVYGHRYFDFYLADTCKSVFGFPAVAFLCLSFSKSKKLLPCVLIGILVCMGWVCMEYFIGGTFDYKNMIGTVVGAVLTWAVYKWSFH